MFDRIKNVLIDKKDKVKGTRKRRSRSFANNFAFQLTPGFCLMFALSLILLQLFYGLQYILLTSTEADSLKVYSDAHDIFLLEKHLWEYGLGSYGFVSKRI